MGAAVQTGDRRPALRGDRHRLRRADRRPPHAARRPLVLAGHAVPAAVLHDAADRPRREDRAVAHLGADGRHPRGQLDGDLASRPARSRAKRSRCTSRARAPTSATTRRPPPSPTATCAPRPTATTTTSWTGRCTARGCSAASRASACRTRRSRRARARSSTARSERLGTSDTAIIQVRRRLMTAARALREQGTPPPGQDPALIPRALGLRRAAARRRLGAGRDPAHRRPPRPVAPARLGRPRPGRVHALGRPRGQCRDEALVGEIDGRATGVCRARRQPREGCSTGQCAAYDRSRRWPVTGWRPRPPASSPAATRWPGGRGSPVPTWSMFQ